MIGLGFVALVALVVAAVGFGKGPDDPVIGLLGAVVGVGLVGGLIQLADRRRDRAR